MPHRSEHFDLDICTTLQPDEEDERATDIPSRCFFVILEFFDIICIQNNLFLCVFCRFFGSALQDPRPQNGGPFGAPVC